MTQRKEGMTEGSKEGRNEGRNEGRKSGWKEGNLSLTPRPFLIKRHVRNDLLLVFQKRRFFWNTKSKCQYDNEVHRQKNSYIEDDLFFLFQNIRINDTHSQG